MAFKAAIRAGSLKSIGTGRGGIASAESHAKRLDPVAQGRVVEPRDPIAWSKAGSGPLDYVEAFKAHKRETGAGERKGAGLAIEFKAVVSPDWLAEGGADPRDPNNPRVQQLVAEAQAWAESWGGNGSVWAVRYDTDEKGAGVVDLFMSPVRQQAHKSGKAKAVISCRKAKAELLEAEQARDPGLKTSGAAMQSSWARWCQQRLDARIERGTSKETTGREHIHAEIYAQEAEKAKAEAAKILNTALENAAAALKVAQEATERAEEAQRQERATAARLEPLRAAVAALDAHEAAEKARERAARQAQAEGGQFEALRDLFAGHHPREMRFGPMAAWVALERDEDAAEVRSIIKADVGDGPMKIRQRLTQLGPVEFQSATLRAQMSARAAEYSHLGFSIRESGSWSDLLNKLDEWGRKIVDKISRALSAESFTLKPAPPPPEAKPATDLPPEVRQALRDALPKRPTR